MKILFLLLIPILSLGQTSTKELAYIQEVNLVRTNPNLYAAFIKSYYLKYRKSTDSSSTFELIRILEKMTPVKPLHVNESVREKMNSITDTTASLTHTGFYVESKVIAENIIIGNVVTEVRNLVIRQLIDSAIKDRSHRKHILDPRFTDIAVKRIVIGPESNKWSQVKFIEEYIQL